MENEKDNKTVFDEVESEEEQAPQEGVATEDPTEQQDLNDEGLDEDLDEPIEMSVANKSKKQLEEERGVKKEMDDMVVTIMEADVLPPRIYKTNEKGVKEKIEPRTTQTGNAQFYSTKLRVRFEEENLVEYYPSIKVWVNDGKIQTDNVQLNSSRYDDDYNSRTKVAQLLRMTLAEMYNEKTGEEIELEEQLINEKPTIVVAEDSKDDFYAFSKTVSDADILEWMVGKKVKLKTARGTYKGSEWFRNDIAEYVDE